MNKEDMVYVHTHTYTYIYTHTMLPIKKENAICGYTGGPRDYHTK